MAAETEGIALLSMYGDDEDEEDTTIAAVEEGVATTVQVENTAADYRNEIPKDNYSKREHSPGIPTDKIPLPFTSPSPLHPLDGSESKTLKSPFLHRTPTPQPPASRSQLSSPLSSTSPVPSPAPARLYNMLDYADGMRSRSALAIVDYAQDETAMSPELDVMEIETFGRVVFGEELHASDGNMDRTPSPQSLTPFSQHEHVPLFQAPELSKFENNVMMDFSSLESEVAEIKVSSSVLTDVLIDKTMQSFLPPTVTTKCPEELQEKINKFLAYKRAGKSFNADLRNRKDYRNPNFLQHAVSYQDIDETGTCFCKEVFDPHGYDKSDYYDVIEADLKRELERKDQERKKSPKIDFVSGCSQPGGVAPVLKTNTHMPATGVSSLPPNPITMDTTRDGRINKKSKWDKVDGDSKASLSSGHDNPPTSASVNASHLSAANAGTGYSAFAQLKRREAEERRSSERKFDKRS